MRSIIRKKGAHRSSYLLQILKKKGLILLRDWVLLAAAAAEHHHHHHHPACDTEVNMQLMEFIYSWCL
jgi:hypothetical protein